MSLFAARAWREQLDAVNESVGRRPGSSGVRGLETLRPSGLAVGTVRPMHDTPGKTRGDPRAWRHPDEVGGELPLADEADLSYCERVEPLGRIVLREHANFVYAIAFARAGEWVVTGSADNSIAVWDASQGFRMRLLIHAAHADSVNALVCSYNMAVSVSDASNAKLWDLETGAEVACIESPSNGWLWGCALRCGGPPKPRSSPPSSLNELLEVWPGYYSVEEQHPANYRLQDLAEAAGGTSAAVIAVGGSQALCLLDSSMRLVHNCKAGNSTIYDVSATADFVVAAGGSSLRIHDWNTGQVLRKLIVSNAKAVRMRSWLSPIDGSPTLLVVGSGDSIVGHFELGLLPPTTGSSAVVSFKVQRHWKTRTPSTAVGVAFHNEFVVAGCGESADSLVALPLSREVPFSDNCDNVEEHDDALVIGVQTGSYHIDVYKNTLASADSDNSAYLYVPEKIEAGAIHMIKSASKA